MHNNKSKSKKVPKGKRIVEFTDKRFHLDGVSETEHKSWSEAQKNLYIDLCIRGFKIHQNTKKFMCSMLLLRS